jgi:hypothetical protein
MKLTTAVTGVQTEGLTETRDFSIKVTGKAFKILLDGLYADKVAAVIRELSTNAYDAHLALGLGSTPFVVHLPTIFAPTFTVRDFGVSMSHEQTMRLMSTVFDSTKDDSNNQVGAFGLGSKSPFALVDTFNLNVIKDGEKRMYSAYVGPDGVPAIALLGSEKTADTTGVEFQMSIAPKDVRAFKERAFRILQWFPTIPTVYEGTTKVTIAPPPVLTSGKGWQLLDASKWTGFSGAMARQGCVVYPLNPASIPSLSADHSALMGSPLVIDFAIGSLDVAASREALSYDVPTCKNIVARLNNVLTEIGDLYGKAIKDAPTLWEAGKKRREIHNTVGLPRALIGMVSNTKWKGTTPTATLDFSKLLVDIEKAGLTVEVNFWDNWRINRSALTVYFDMYAQNDARRPRWDYGDDSLAVYFTIANDRPSYEGRRIRMDIDAKNSKAAGPYRTPRAVTSAVCFVIANEADAKTILDLMGNPPSAGFTKDLTAPVIPARAPPPKRGTTKKEEVKVREISQVNGGYTAQPEKVIPLDGDALYLFSRDSTIQGLPGRLNTMDAHATFNEFCSVLDAASVVGAVPAGPIYIVSTIYQKRVEAFGKLKNFSDEVKAAMVDFDSKITKEVEQTNLVKLLAGDRWTNLIVANPRYGKLAADLKTGPLHAMHSLVVSQGYDTVLQNFLKTRDYPKCPNLSAMWSLRLLGVDGNTINERVQKDLNKNTNLLAITKASAACDAAYPLISGWDHHRLVDFKLQPAILQYIEALDRHRAPAPPAGPPPQAAATTASP